MNVMEIPERCAPPWRSVWRSRPKVLRSKGGRNRESLQGQFSLGLKQNLFVGKSKKTCQTHLTIDTCKFNLNLTEEKVYCVKLSGRAKAAVRDVDALKSLKLKSKIDF